MKIPRDASRPKLEDLVALAEEIPGLPFQPDEEDVLESILDNAQTFRDRLARYCNPLVSTSAEAETQRFYLRKLEGAEVLLTFETNFFRQELHKWCPVAPEAPPILEVSLSTRKPRPTKLMKMLIEYGVENPDDLPESVKGKANSLRRKAANAEAAAAAAAATHTLIASSVANLPHGADAAYSGDLDRRASTSQSADGAVGGSEKNIDPSLDTATSLSPQLHGAAYASGRDNRPNDPMEIDHPQSDVLGASGPRVIVDDSMLSIEERLLAGKEINLQSDAEKQKALEILSRTEMGQRKAEEIWGPDVWNPSRDVHHGDDHVVSSDVDIEMKADESKVEEMFREMTHQDEDEDSKKKDVEEEKPAAGETLAVNESKEKSMAEEDPVETAVQAEPIPETKASLAADDKLAEPQEVSDNV